MQLAKTICNIMFFRSLTEMCSLGSKNGYFGAKCRPSNTGFGIWDLPRKSSTKAKFGTLGLNWDFFWDHFHTLLGLLVVIFIKMPQNLQKAKKDLKTV